MIKLYFTLFYQRIKNKFSLFFLNFIGYVVLLSVISFISLFIYGELTYDNFKKKDRIYRIVNSIISGSESMYNLNSSLLTLEDINKDYPEVESIVCMALIRDINITSNEKQLTQNVMSFKGDFLNIFTPDFIYGNNLSFNQIQNGCLITKSFSEKNYKKSNPIGEILVLVNSNDTMQVVVNGVIDDFQNTTCMQSDIFIKSEKEFGFQNGYADLAFLLLKENNKIDKLNNIQGNEYEYNGIKYKEGFVFQPLKEVYLKSEFLNFNFYPSGNLKLIFVFSIAVLLMLLCIIFNYNFMFIILTRQRIREFSIKRIFGVKKSSVLYGVFSDNIIFVFIAACFAYLISKKAYSFIDSLNIALKDYFQWFDEVFVITFFTVLFITMVVPIFYYKSILKYRRLDRLKTSNEGKDKNLFGNMFLGVQIIVAFVLLAFSFIIKSQLQYAVNRDLGIKNRELIIMKNELSDQDFNLFSQEIKKISIVSDVTRIGTMPPSNFPQGMTRVKCFSYEEKEILTAMLFVDKNTLETIGVTYVQGEGFRNYNNYKTCCVISESLADQIGVDNLIGYEVKSGLKIIGVVKDISLAPVRKENYPLIIVCNPEMCDEIIVNYTTQDAALGEKTSRIYETLFKKNTKLTFYEDHLKSLYQEENFMLQYMTAFSILTLLLVFFGFYFYARSIVDLRSRNIVIRKIHGATSQNIIKLLMKEYLIVFLVSILIASWLFTYITNIWLSGFMFHVDKSIMHYIYPSILILLILVFAVLNNVLRLAHKNIITSINNYR